MLPILTRYKHVYILSPPEYADVMERYGNYKTDLFRFLKMWESFTAFNTLHPPVPLPPQSQQRANMMGDSMYFIDVLTRLSFDMVRLPKHQRLPFLQSKLHSLNYILSRRMHSHGELTLENPTPWELPAEPVSVSAALLHSVPLHLPTTTTSDSAAPAPAPGVYKILRVLPEHARMLSSREKAPFLLMAEVAEVDWDENDPRTWGEEPPCESTREPEQEVGWVGEVQQPRGGGYEDECASPPPPASYQLGRAPPDSYVPPDSYAPSDSYAPPSSYGGPYSSPPPPPPSPYQLDPSSMPYYSDPPSPPPPLTTGLELLDKVFGIPFAELERSTTRTSPFSHIPRRKLCSFVIKSGDDVRKESLVMMLIEHISTLFEKIPCGPTLRPYSITCTGHDKGVIEVIRDSVSVDELKKNTDGFTSLADFFKRAFGADVKNAQTRFLRSLVGYSLVCYILQIKDRHNGNIMLTRDGTIIHIDFGYVLGDTPKMAKVPIFNERAPMKLTQEYWDVFGGWGGRATEFLELFEKGFEICREHREEIALIVEQGIKVTSAEGGKERSGKKARAVAEGIVRRLEGGGRTRRERQEFIKELVAYALNDWSTSTYDWLQRSLNGYTV